MKHLKTLVLVFSIFTVSFLISCSKDDLGTSLCSGCNSDSPYGTVGSSTCYETLADCDAGESGTCTRCD